MFITEGFWRSIILFILGLVVVYFILNVTVFKKLQNKSKAQNILLNVFVFLGVLFLFYKLYSVIPEIINPPQFYAQNILNRTLYVCVLALATTGIVLIFKTSNTTNFAQGMIGAVGAFVAAKLVIYFTATYTTMGNTPMILLALVGGALVAFLLGVFVDVVIIRNSKMPTVVGKQMITMGLVLIFTGVIPLIFGTIPMSVPKLVYGDNIAFTLLGLELVITPNALAALVITIVVLGILFIMLRVTKWGLGVRATASNEVVASMMGVNTKMITAMSWGIAGLLGGIAATMWAPNTSSVGVDLMIPTQVNGFMAAILGGFGSFVGPLISSMLIPVLTGLLSFVALGWENAVVYAVILAIVLFKPLGLFGKQVAKKV
ncbi:MAG: branched-chain amino acid ABC transporter permease [Tenericutes bacterium]|nr:branched-chain amino acid ABC transporter permease [Mycoplasmatota bacterium]